ncbi:MAG TPA: hypothetical protein PL029_09095, partial [Bacteroidia bacterium]|nr:hypothetical protein [Bacteroidia bacterium]
MTAAAFFASFLVPAQSFQWARNMGGSDLDYGNGIVTDATGNVYTVGSFYDTGDFDPGPGSYSLTSVSPGLLDIYISKLDAAGNFVWAKSIGGVMNEWGNAISLDPSGDIYITGTFQDVVDFDPGPGTFTLAAPSSNVFFGNIFVLKLNAAGNFMWARSLDYFGASNSIAIKTDALGNCYTTGYFSVPVDFDPGPGTYSLSPQSNDAFVLKLNPAGNFIWARSFGGPNANITNPRALGVDSEGAAYTTGVFTGTVDFNPGGLTYSLASIGNFNAFLSKLDSSGNFVWAKNFGDLPNTAGNTNTYGNALGIDAGKNVYLTGIYTGPTDFDPGTATYTLPYVFGYDQYISKFDSTGIFMWARNISGTGDDNPLAMAVDPTGNSYMTGYFAGTSDFDPGTGSYSLTSAGIYDLYILKLNAAGSFLWAKSIGGNSIEVGNAITVDALGSIYTTGYFYSNGTDFDPGTSTNTLSPAPSWCDAFVLKLAPCLGPAGIISGPATLCSGASSNYSVNSVTNALSYLWTLPGGTTYTSSLNSTTVTTGSGTSPGFIMVTPVNACGSGLTASLALNVSSSPTITVSSGTLCDGQSFTLSPSGAVSYTYSGNSAVVNPSLSTTYSVTGTNSVGCVTTNAALATITVYTLPVVSVTA